MSSFWKLGFVLVVLLTVFCGFAGVSPAQVTQDGGLVTGLWNTGVDGSGNPLPDTAPENHYSIGPYVYTGGAPGPSQIVGGNYVYSGTNAPSFVSSGSAGAGFPAGSSALIIAATATGDAPYTLPPLNIGSEWIGPGSSSTTGVAPGGLQQNGPSDLSGTSANGYYDFETTFNLTTAGSFTISGSFSADNRVIDTLVDGVSTGIGSTCSPAHDYGSGYYNTYGPADFAQWTPFTLSGTGSQGVNDLDFIVWNSSPSDIALRVEFTPTPEPGTLALLGAGGAVLAGYGWRRRRSQRSEAVKCRPGAVPEFESSLRKIRE
jgi:hypothetical protein